MAASPARAGSEETGSVGTNALSQKLRQGGTSKYLQPLGETHPTLRAYDDDSTLSRPTLLELRRASTARYDVLGNLFAGGAASAAGAGAAPRNLTPNPLESADDDEEAAAAAGAEDSPARLVRASDKGDPGVYEPAAREAPKRVQFGMWDGVLARCLLNIWGVILFLRVGWMVGYAGIGLSLLIIILSGSVTMVTTLSLSAICTNGQVAGGGAYFLIARALGPRYGGSIGIMFFLANAVAIALYLVGFAETIVEQTSGVIVHGDWDLRIIAFVTLVLLLGLCLVGVAWVIKFQLSLLVLLVVSILSFLVGSLLVPDNSSIPAFIGFDDDPSRTSITNNVSAVGIADVPVVSPTTGSIRNWGPDWSGDAANFPTAAEVVHELYGDVDFAACLKVFFPAVTGIMAGANISGDLKDPGTAIPTGTIWSVMVSTVVYLALAFIIGAVAARTVVHPDGALGGLLHDSILMARLSFWPPIMFGGLYAAALSSGLASLVGAPRILQAVAKDNLFPSLSYFGKGHGAENEPVRAYVLTFVIAVAMIMIGDLNAVAGLITNFFMASYALVNFACFMASVSKAPGWRPAFKYYNKWVALAGTVACFATMMLLDRVMGVVTCIVGLALYKFIEVRGRTEPVANWGSAEEGLWYVDAVKYLLRLNAAQLHVKNWRPALLVLTGHPRDRPGLVDFANHVMASARGVTIFGQVVIADFTEYSTRTGFPRLQESMDSFIHEARLGAFGHAVVAPRFSVGVESLMQLGGLGRLRPNTLVMGLLRDWVRQPDERVSEYVQAIGSAFDMECGVAVVGDHVAYREAVAALAALPTPGKGTLLRPAAPVAETIDCWWLADDGGLTVLIPHLLMANSLFKRTCRLRLMVPGAGTARLAREQSRLTSLLKSFRLDAEVVPVHIDAKAVIPKTLRDTFESFNVGAYGAAPDDAEEPADPSDIGAGTNGDAGGVDPRGGAAAVASERLRRSAGTRNRSASTQGEGFDSTTASFLRYAAVIREQSRKARMVFVSLPVPRTDINPRLYMAHMDLLFGATRVGPDGAALPAPSKDGTPKQAVVLLRGNQESVLTHLS